MSPKLLITLLVLASGSLYYFLINPLYTGDSQLFDFGKGIVALRQEKVEYTTTLAKVEDIIKQANELRTEYASVTDEEKNKINLMVPDTMDRTRLLSEMINMTNIIGITVKELAVGVQTPPTATTLGTYSVGFTLTATYPRFKELIRKFETNMRLFRLDSVSFSPSEKDPETISYKVRFSTFYIK